MSAAGGRYETRALDYEGPFDLGFSLGPLSRGRSDPTTRVTPTSIFRASRTPEGPATLHAALERASADGGRVVAEAWGPGAAWMLERLPATLGLDRPPVVIEPIGPFARGGRFADAARRAAGLRLPRPGRVTEQITPIVLEQLVTGKESKRAFRGLVRNFSDPAPGPGLNLMLPLSGEQLRALPPMSFLPLGVHPDQGRLLRDLGWRASRLDALADRPHAEVREKLLALRGVGPWTVGCLMGLAMGDPDAVAVGDYHLKNIVAWNLADEERGTDERMLELLAPWAGQRGVVTRVLKRFGDSPPRYGPRMSVRETEGEWIPTRRGR